MTNKATDNNQPSSKASVEVVTLGCRLNAYESDKIKAIAEKATSSDTIVVNSCAVTTEAIRQSRQQIRKARRRRPEAKIVVTGCAAQIDPDHFSAMPEVDAVLGNMEKLSESEWRKLNTSSGPHLRVNDIMSVKETAGALLETYGERARAFLQIQTGCDHRCTFCIIPFGRGNSRSLPINVIVEEAKSLVAQGTHELVLTGVDMTSYGADLPGTPSLAELVKAILEATPTLFSLRLSSVDCAEVDDALFELLVSDDRIAPYLHLSLQSGNNLILKRMKRRHSREQAIDLCQRLRARRPGFAFGADIIVGFPTESDEMFEESVTIIDEAGLSFVHVFPYSAHDQTPASRMPQVEKLIIKQRAARLRQAAAEALDRLHEKMLGDTQAAIIESGGRVRFRNFASARLHTNGEQSPHAGKVARFSINKIVDGTLLASLTPQSGA